MRAGKLDRLITIQRATSTLNGFNEAILTWADVDTVWAQQRPIRGAERFQASEIAGSKVMTFHIRYRADLTVTDRLVYEDRVWEIVDIRELGRRVVTEIDAHARAETPA